MAISHLMAHRYFDGNRVIPSDNVWYYNHFFCWIIYLETRKIKYFKAACPMRDVICCKNTMYMVYITQHFANISIPSLTWDQRKIGSKSQMKVSVKRAHLKWFYNSAIFTTFMATVCINLFLQSYFLLPFFNVI